MINKTIAKTLRQARLKAGLTQLEVANKLKLDSQQFIHLMEAAKSKVPFKTLGQLVEIYKISNREQNSLIDELINDYKSQLMTEFKDGKKQ